MQRDRSHAFPPLDAISALGQSDYERDFLRREFEPGLQYFLDRLDRILFKGESLLDAGCGAGQWSLAAAQRFDRVESIDVAPPRLEVLRSLADRMGVSNIVARQGVIEALPCEQESFDAVICYGVVMFADIQKALAEFHRVLRPGGRLYLCLNADGWSRYLIRERGVSEERALDAGRQTLHNTHWRRAVAAGIEAQLLRAGRQLEQLFPEWFGSRARGVIVRARTKGWRIGVRAARAIARHCLSTTDAGVALMRQVADDCGTAFEERLVDEVWEMLQTGHRPARHIPSEAYQPEELQELAVAAGFASFQWSVEGALACDWLRPEPAAKYAGYYNDELSVWEALFTKPQVMPLWDVDPARHLAAARTARDERLFLEPAPHSVLSDASRDGYPQDLVNHARSLAAQIGGPRYLEALALKLVDGSVSDEERVRRLIVFVQRSIFRDPISQPLTSDGDTPDALTILLCSRGRCSHTASVLVELFRHAGFDARARQLANHVVAEVLVNGRWALADADAFKNGVIPVNRSAELLTMDDLLTDPYQLDRFQPSGWWIRKGSRFARGVGGGSVYGYVDALDPDRRGFVSGYYVPAAKGAPPSLPAITRFEIRHGRLFLEWTASTVAGSQLRGYRVAVGSTSRGWTYEHPGDGDEILRPCPCDLLRIETASTRVDMRLDVPPSALFASVTACSDRIELEPDTYFWPSEEEVCER